eukprot:s529_g17.t1
MDESRAGLYVNEGYRCIADGVCGGFLDLMPIKGAKFLHREWEHVNTCIPGNMRYVCHEPRQVGTVMYPVRPAASPSPGATFLDKHNAARLQTIIRCDEGGWVLVNDLVRRPIKLVS